MRADIILFQKNASHQEDVLTTLSEALAKTTDQDDRIIYEKLFERERLGSTGMGHGVAIPHARLEGLDRVYFVLMTTAKPAEFDAVDGQGVDVFFALLAPQNAGADHLQALARASRLLRDTDFCDKIRGADSADAIQGLLVEAEAAEADAA